MKGYVAKVGRRKEKWGWVHLTAEESAGSRHKHKGFVNLFMIYGSRNCTISTIFGSRIFLSILQFLELETAVFLRFLDPETSSFLQFLDPEIFGPYSQFLDPETAEFLQFLDPETAIFLQFLDHQMSPRECPSYSVTHQWVRSC